MAIGPEQNFREVNGPLHDRANYPSRLDPCGGDLLRIPFCALVGLCSASCGTMLDDHGAPSSLEPSTLDVALGASGLAFPGVAMAADGAAVDATSPSVQSSPPSAGPLGFHRGVWVVLVSAAATLLLLALYTLLIPARTATLIVGPAQPGMRLILDGVDHGPVPAVVPWLSAGEHEVVVGRSGEPRSLVSRINLAPGQTLELAPRVEKTRKRPKLLAGHGAAGAEAQCGLGHVQAAPVVEPADLPQALEPHPQASGVSSRSPAAPPFAPPNTPVAVLGLNSLPSASVLLDGRPIGKTPLRTEVVPGPHRATFVHPELGRRSVTVNAVTERENLAAVRF